MNWPGCTSACMGRQHIVKWLPASERDGGREIRCVGDIGIFSVLGGRLSMTFWSDTGSCTCTCLTCEALSHPNRLPVRTRTSLHQRQITQPLRSCPIPSSSSFFLQDDPPNPFSRLTLLPILFVLVPLYTFEPLSRTSLDNVKQAMANSNPIFAPIIHNF